MQVEDAVRRLEATLNPLLGKSKQQVLLELGAPTGTRSIAEFELWDYFRSYGVRTSHYSTQNTSGTGYTNYNAYPGTFQSTTNLYGSSTGLGTSQSWEVYDRFTLYFNTNGLMAKWDGYVQR